MQWMLSSFKTVQEVRKNLNSVRVVNVDDPNFGGADLPFHWKIAEPSGTSIVIDDDTGRKHEIREITVR